MVQEQQIKELIEKWEAELYKIEYRIASYKHHGTSFEAKPYEAKQPVVEAIIADLKQLIKE